MSIANTDKLRARVATLDKLLDDFDGQLDDLLAKSLPETLLGLDTLQQAKLQVTVPYLVYDLVIIYLKTKGIDPRTHPVFRELERVKEYIEKVSRTEKRESEQQRMAIDKVAANRFIKHAITQAVRAQDQPSQPTGQEPTPGPSKIRAQPVPTGAASKMLARAAWEKQVQEAGEEEEEGLEIFDETEDNANIDADVEMSDNKASTSMPFPAVPEETSILSEQQPATTKKKKKTSKKAKPPLTGSALTAPAMDKGSSTLSRGPTTNPGGLLRQPESPTDPTPENPSAARSNNKKPLFPPPETATGDLEDPASASAATPAPQKSKKRKRNGKKSVQAIAGAETDGTASRSQSQSQSRDVSVTPTPQVATQQLPDAEVDNTATGVVEKPKKRRKNNRKKNGNGQRTTETST